MPGGIPGRICTAAAAAAAAQAGTGQPKVESACCEQLATCKQQAMPCAAMATRIILCLCRVVCRLQGERAHDMPNTISTDHLNLQGTQLCWLLAKTLWLCTLLTVDGLDTVTHPRVHAHGWTAWRGHARPHARGHAHGGRAWRSSSSSGGSDGVEVSRTGVRRAH